MAFLFRTSVDRSSLRNLGKRRSGFEEGAIVRILPTGVSAEFGRINPACPLLCRSWNLLVASKFPSH
jgi:hypothetical protein